MKSLFKSYPIQSHNIPSNPTIISTFIIIYIISIHLLEKIKDHCDENEYIIEDSKFRANTRYKVGGNLQQYRRLLSTLENLKCIRLFKRGKGKKQYIALNPKLVN